MFSVPILHICGSFQFPFLQASCISVSNSHPFQLLSGLLCLSQFCEYIFIIYLHKVRTFYCWLKITVVWDSFIYLYS
jgi:hypothetical protein